MKSNRAILKRAFKASTAVVSIMVVASCGGSNIFGGGNRDTGVAVDASTAEDYFKRTDVGNPINTGDGTSIFDIFKKQDNGTNVKVNRYLWNASLDILSFLPIQSVDPFTGVIVTGYGTPPGGGRAYRATILIKDPALEARALSVALATRGGAVSAGTQRAVEDAILARARQLRIKDGKL